MEERDGSDEDAIIAYNDCLSRYNEHKEAMVSLARLYQNTGSNEQCSSYCNKLLKIDPSNEQATFMFANLMLMKDQTEGAIQTYIQLLEKTPDNFNTLSQLIELMRRAGRLSDIPKYLENAEKACQRSSLSGLHFCKGLYHRCIGEPQQALKNLNTARFDNFYGQPASVNMIEIYLNPTNEMIHTSQTGNDEQVYSATTENIAVANELI